ncbi:hypothetical protein LSH36_16g10049 [Paralvinella palmiformis]|uniref:Uncharacterized protein n=1 Tax=Paralvinella palmiformis TaxID=53620 RepID=A0AAD9KBY5_9ANNE|nr:hypothetical protein LSH36_16g10049 [Paralvinella palmiformis]
MWNQHWSTNICHHAIFCLTIMTIVTGMAVNSRSKKDTLAIQTSPDVEPWRPYYISHSCEWTLLSLNCPMGRVINVVRASYGRQNLDYCPHLRAKSGLNWDTPCVGSISKSRRIVSGM